MNKIPKLYAYIAPRVPFRRYLYSIKYFLKYYFRYRGELIYSYIRLLIFVYISVCMCLRTFLKLDGIVSSDWTVLINAKGSGRNRSCHILKPRHLPRGKEESHAMPFKSDSYRIGVALGLESLAL